jgi:hypothetical protein
MSDQSTMPSTTPLTRGIQMRPDEEGGGGGAVTVAAGVGRGLVMGERRLGR